MPIVDGIYGQYKNNYHLRMSTFFILKSLSTYCLKVNIYRYNNTSVEPIEYNPKIAKKNYMLPR